MKPNPTLIRRLEGYWKLEAGNVVVIPGVAAYVIHEAGGVITPGVAISMLATSSLLVIGTLSLRIMLRRARGEADPTRGRIPLLAALQWPALLLCAAAAVATIVDWIARGPHPLAERLAASVLTLLAILEYVNYYHVQLQHFDHAPDWKRLSSGRGFRPSHLAREIDRWKRAKSRGGE
jgi:hypothetical protein